LWRFFQNARVPFHPGYFIFMKKIQNSFIFLKNGNEVQVSCLYGITNSVLLVFPETFLEDWNYKMPKVSKLVEKCPFHYNVGLLCFYACVKSILHFRKILKLKRWDKIFTININNDLTYEMWFHHFGGLRSTQIWSSSVFLALYNFNPQEMSQQKQVRQNLLFHKGNLLLLRFRFLKK